MDNLCFRLKYEEHLRPPILVKFAVTAHRNISVRFVLLRRYHMSQYQASMFEVGVVIGLNLSVIPGALAPLVDHLEVQLRHLLGSYKIAQGYLSHGFKIQLLCLAIHTPRVYVMHSAHCSAQYKGLRSSK